MNIKVVLSSLPYYNHIYTPPIQLAYLKACLEQDKDIEVKTIDMETRCFNSSIISRNPILYWNKMWNRDFDIKEDEKKMLDEFVNIILSESPSVVGFSVTFSNFSFTRYVSKQLRKINPALYIVYGGRYFCLRDPWRYWVKEWHGNLEDVDCIVKNEGEASLMELVTALKRGIKPKCCKGTTIRDGDRITDFGDRPLIENLDTIPFPDFSNFSKKDYLENYIRILFSRGCIGRCVYCVENDTMGTFRNRGAQNIVDEIKLRVSQGYRRFQACDLALNSNLANLLEVCSLIIEENLDIEFTFSEFRNAANLTPKAFNLLYKAGFRTICFGTESGSQKILNKMDKKIKVETIEKNFKDAHNEGLKVILYLMTGFPGETEETFLETIAMLRRNKGFINGITAIAPTEICGGSRIQDHLDDYDLNPGTLFKSPDIWESKDGKNCLKWRKGIKDRMIRHLNDFKIPLVDFISDGNPRIPLDYSNLLNSEKIKEYRRRASLSTMNEKSSLMLQYAAQLIVHKMFSNEGSAFVMEIVNIGDKEWGRTESDWIRIGCRIYDEARLAVSPIKEFRQDLPRNIKKDEKFQIVFTIEEMSLPKGRYRLKFDMVNEFQFWFEDLDSQPIVEYVEL